MIPELISLHDPIRISHPMADKVSVQDTKYHHCTPGKSSEIAFFKNGNFVVDPIAPFEKYHDGSDPATHTTAVYDYVPNELIDEFLSEYRLDKA
jgi:hypothetical protein